MEIKQLKALVTVAEAGSVTRAAELLHLVQPAVTRQIHALEHELGVPLFERTRHGMRLTEAGSSMAERARRVLDELERAQAEIRPTPNHVTGIVTVGLLESTLGILAEPLVKAVTGEHPGIELRVLTAYSGHLRQWLDDGDLDLSLLYNLTNTPSLHVRPLIQEKLWAVAPPAAGLDPRHPIPFEQAAAQPLIVPTAGHGLRILIDRAVARSDVRLTIVTATNSILLQKKLVLAGCGWTILPAAGIADEVGRGLVSAAPLRDPEISRSIVLGAPRTARRSAAVDVVTREIVRQIRSAVRRGNWPSALLDSAEDDRES
ncbi:LysR family transcriptional regulator [Acrocarpospora pleiomorpha]|uniref:LysR family transcriptional regulator n=1 Tax=Acrocarpospora pleiomorpha TaxID=90975 RepID=A0A5M3XQW4_9ACTN|nr:LysR family transcriptional regulator [Acrocarpospora pleiomorpha]GES20708.1 LysR family transcriptional regulator [Acrocarpospora pleiomorpha]